MANSAAASSRKDNTNFLFTILHILSNLFMKAISANFTNLYFFRLTFKHLFDIVSFTKRQRLGIRLQ